MAVLEIPVVLFSSDWAPKAVLKIGYGSQVSSQAIAEEKPRNIRLNVSGIFSQPASEARCPLPIISVLGSISFFMMMILSSLFFCVVSVVRRRFPKSERGGDAPQAKKASPPRFRFFCAHLTASRSLLLLKKILSISPVDYSPPPEAWISLVPVGH